MTFLRLVVIAYCIARKIIVEIEGDFNYYTVEQIGNLTMPRIRPSPWVVGTINHACILKQIFSSLRTTGYLSCTSTFSQILQDVAYSFRDTLFITLVSYSLDACTYIFENHEVKTCDGIYSRYILVRLDYLKLVNI